MHLIGLHSPNDVFLAKYAPIHIHRGGRPVGRLTKEINSKISKGPIQIQLWLLLGFPKQIIFELLQLMKPTNRNPMCRNYGHTVDRNKSLGINARCLDCKERINDPSQLRKAVVVSKNVH